MPTSSAPSKLPEVAATTQRIVIVIDDDHDVRDATEQTLILHGFAVKTFARAEDVISTMDIDFPGVIVCDVRMPGMDGRQFFSRLQQIDREIPVILMTGHGDVDMAVEAMHRGAYDFLTKPYDNERLVHSVQRAHEKRRLVQENRWLREHDNRSEIDDSLIGTTPAMARLRQTMHHIADADVDILVQGETGTGKEVVAQALHDASHRRQQPFVAINCGALPESVIESELFGHEAGAFTGAQKRRIGRIEFSSGGTLFLDEIESMPLPLQVKLLRVLETRQITPLGSNEVRTLDLRVIAATKDNLAHPAARSYFREDLYYRLNVVTLRLPALRERRDDIPVLFARFVSQASKRFSRTAPVFDQATLDYLRLHKWPGNVRELVHFAERFVLGIPNEQENGWDSPMASAAEGPTSLPLPARVDQFEAEVIRQTLIVHKGDVKNSISDLGIPRKTFYDKLQRYSIDRTQYTAAHETSALSDRTEIEGSRNQPDDSEA